MATLDVVQPDETRRRRITASLTALGIALSLAAFHVSILTRAQYFEEAVRMEGWGAFFYSIAAILAALIVVPISIYHFRDMAQNPAHPIAWLFMGFVFGVLTPLFTGGFNRAAAAFTGLVEGHVSIGNMPSLLLDAVFVYPYDFIVQGAIGVVVGIESGLIFAPSAFIVDRLNASKNEIVSLWGPWVAASLIGLTVLLFALLGPIDFLRDVDLG